MELLLRQDVENVGLRGEVVNVARGYARNYLLPRGLAEVATPALQAEVLKRDAQRARHEAKTVDEARAIAQRLEAKEIRFDVNAGPTGSLFGSVTATNVADRLWSDGKIRVDRRKIQMETIKRVGRYTVPVEIFTDVTAELHLVVAPEGEVLPTEEELAALAAAEEAAAAAATEAAATEHAEAEAAVATVAAEDDSAAIEEVEAEAPSTEEPQAGAASDEDPASPDEAEESAEPKH
jgi:large subunit ribosomal protein L9